MKLIIVERSKRAAFTHLSRMFADDINVAVVLERRTRQRRKKSDSRSHERRVADRRRLAKPWNGRDFIVIHTAEH